MTPIYHSVMTYFCKSFMPIPGWLVYAIFASLDLFPAFYNLSHYLDLYWNLTFISNDTIICGTYARHPQGQLQSIYYHGHFGAPILQEGHRIQQIMEPYALDNSYGFQNLIVRTTAVHLYMMTVTGAQLIWMLCIISVQCVT